jgi:hypothetical protein
MNFTKIYEVTHNLDAPLQPIEDGRPVREAEEQEQTATNPEKEGSLGTKTENSQEVSTETDTSQGIDDLKKLSKILETGQPDTIKNKEQFC